MRGFLAVVAATVYLLAGVLHGLHDIDVANPSGQPEISVLLDGATGHGEGKAQAGHHCHGCFSVAAAQTLQPVTIVRPAALPNPPRLPTLAGIVPDTDSPPPKLLA